MLMLSFNDSGLNVKVAAYILNFIHIFIYVMASSVLPGGGAGATCGARDQTTVPAVA